MTSATYSVPIRQAPKLTEPRSRVFQFLPAPLPPGPPLAIDASTPVLAAASNDPWVTASFTPPVDSLLVCVVMGDGFNAVPTYGITSTGLTFISRIKVGGVNQGVVEIFTCAVGANGGSARTISATTTNTADTGGLKVWVITSANNTNPVDDTGSAAGSTVNQITPVATQTTMEKTWTFGGAVDWQGLGIATSTDVEESFDDDISILCVHKATSTALPGDVTLDFDAAAGTPLWTWAAIAIKPAFDGSQGGGLAETPADALGLTDAIALDRGEGAADAESLTDIAALARDTVTAESLDLTDIALVEKAREQLAADALDLTDATLIEKAREQAAADTLGLTDATALDRGEVATDALGLTDSVAPVLTRAVTDSLGLTDAMTFARELAALDALALTDAAELDPPPTTWVYTANVVVG